MVNQKMPNAKSSQLKLDSKTTFLFNRTRKSFPSWRKKNGQLFTTLEYNMCNMQALVASRILVSVRVSTIFNKEK